MMMLMLAARFMMTVLAIQVYCLSSFSEHFDGDLDLRYDLLCFAYVLVSIILHWL